MLQEHHGFHLFSEAALLFLSCMTTELNQNVQKKLLHILQCHLISLEVSLIRLLFLICKNKQFCIFYVYPTKISLF